MDDVIVYLFLQVPGCIVYYLSKYRHLYSTLEHLSLPSFQAALRSILYFLYVFYNFNSSCKQVFSRKILFLLGFNLGLDWKWYIL